MIYSIEDIKAALVRCADQAIFFKPMLTLLDNYSGDGDMDISIEKGALALKKVMELSNVKDIGEFFDLCGKRFNQAAASTIGTLVSSALFMLGIKFRGKTELTEAEVVLIPSYMSDAISINGHAKLGDKTILDSLIPFSVSFQKEYEKTGGYFICKSGSGTHCQRICKSNPRNDRYYWQRKMDWRTVKRLSRPWRGSLLRHSRFDCSPGENDGLQASGI